MCLQVIYAMKVGGEQDDWDKTWRGLSPVDTEAIHENA